MRRLHFSSKSASWRGSAIIGVLIVLATLSIVVGAVVSMANHNTRLTRAQLENEAAYTAAMSGIHTGRALLNYPTLLLTMLNRASLGEDVSGLLNPENVTNTLDGLSGMVADVVNGDLGGLVPGVDPLTGGLLTRHGLGSALHRLSDGRLVLIDVPLTNGKVIGFSRDTNSAMPAQNLFKCESADGFESYVDRLRITTVPLNNLTGLVTLKDVALIIEARGVVDMGGRRKERIVQERVLIYPDITKAPLVSAGAAILTGGGLKALSNANFNVAWGAVFAKGDIELTSGLTFLPSLLGKSKLVAGDGFRGAGVNIPGFTDLGQPMQEKWLKWQAGEQGSLKIKEQKIRIPLLGDLLAGLLGGVNPPTDVFSQIKNGGLLNGVLGLLTPDKVQLDGKYTASLNNGESAGLYEKNEQGNAQNGALIQKNPDVDETVDGFMASTMNYSVWKDRAIKRNQYLRPLEGARAGESSYGNSFGQPLYITSAGVLTTQDEGNQPLSNLNQLSMADKISGASGLVHRTDNQKVDDSFLFVDFLTGNEDSPGAIQEYFLGNGFMYKGILYICGNVKLGDASGNPTVFAKSPDQFAADPDSVNRGQALNNVVVDGILFSKGTVTSVGNAVIYGTLGAKGALESDKSPTVFYNFTNSLGRLQLPIKSDVKAQVVLGRVYEVNRWAH